MTSGPQRQLSQLTEFFILRVLPNKVRTLQGLLAYALDDGLHGHDIPELRLYEKGIHLIHLRKERANGLVTSRLVGHGLMNVIDQLASSIIVRWTDLGSKRENSPGRLRIRMDLEMG